MPNNKVTFDEPGMNYGSGPRGPRQSWITKIVLKLGLAKDPRQAVVVLIAIGILAVVVGFVLWPKTCAYEIVPQPGLDLTVRQN